MLQLNRGFLADIGLGHLAPGPASVVLANLATECAIQITLVDGAIPGPRRAYRWSNN